MFIGHYAVGFASKRLAPEASLGALFVAALWADLLWPVFLLIGVERVRIVPGATAVVPFVFEYYPYSHSLLAAILWSVCLGAVWFALRRSLRSALVISAAVLSHWLLDALVHVPDLPIGLSGGARLGLGLWNSAAATLFVEGAIFAAGAALYLRAARPIDRSGRYGAWALIATLTIIYAGQFSGAVPPNETVVALTGLSQWGLIFFGHWVDGHRRVKQV